LSNLNHKIRIIPQNINQNKLESRSIAVHFIMLMEDNKLFDILDVRVKECYQNAEVIFVADIAKRCLNLNERSHIRIGEDNWTVSKRAKYSTKL